jgi:hypothetical protein
MERKDVFPAPEGPMMAKNSPEDSFPDTPEMIVF